MAIDIEAIYATRRTYAERILSLNPQLSDAEAEDLFDYFEERGQFTIVPAGRVISYIHPTTGKRVEYAYKENRYYLKKARYFGEIVTYTPRTYEIHLSGKVEIKVGVCPKCRGYLRLREATYICQECGARVKREDRIEAWKPLGTAKSPIFYEVIFYSFHSYYDAFELEKKYRDRIEAIADSHIADLWKDVNWDDMRFTNRNFGVESEKEVGAITSDITDYYDSILYYETVENDIVKEDGSFFHEVV